MSEAKGLSPVIHAIAWRVNLAVWLSVVVAVLGLALVAYLIVG